MITHPDPTEHSAFHGAYIALVPQGDIVETLEKEGEAAYALFAGLTDERAEQPWAPGKWTIKQTIGHVIDTERVITYRAMRTARRDTTVLPGFEQDDYVAASNAGSRTVASLAEEFQAVRRSTVLMFRGFPADAWDRRANANGMETTVRAFAYIACGHELNHRRQITA